VWGRKLGPLYIIQYSLRWSQHDIGTAFFLSIQDLFLVAQSRQSARLPLQSSELGPPIPHPLASVASPLWFRGGEDILACGPPNSDEGTDIVILYG
jgi:hypothetical protein